MVKPLVFKGEKRSKKRKIFDVQDSSNIASEVLDNRAITQSIADESNGDDNWVSAELPSEVAGPTIFILPSTPPACIACDANGKVFVSDIENTIDGDPATAEPHDVRQVWIASRVAGTDRLSFKGHHGR